MQQFLFSVEVPPSQGYSTGASYAHEWIEFAKSADTILKSHKGSSKLLLHSWLLPADHAWPALERLAASATTHHLSYSVILIPDGAVVLTSPAKS